MRMMLEADGKAAGMMMFRSKVAVTSIVGLHKCPPIKIQGRCERALRRSRVHVILNGYLQQEVQTY